MTALAASRRTSIAPILLAATPTFALLVGLGVWQLQRLAWKEGVLAEIDSRMHAAATPLPPASQWAALAASDYDYTHVSVSGRFEPGREALIFRASGGTATTNWPGYWIMTPFDVDGGGTLLVNRGFIPAERKADASREAALPTGSTTIAGFLRPPETHDFFTPADNAATGQWFTRDTPAIAAALNLRDAAPFSLDEDAYPAQQGQPAGGATVLSIPNNHLQYAVTWFGLAAALAGVVVAFIRRRRASAA